MLHEGVEHLLAKPMSVRMELFCAEHADLRTEEQLEATYDCSPIPPTASQLEWGVDDTKKELLEVAQTRQMQSNTQFELTHSLPNPDILSSSSIREQGLTKYSLDTEEFSSVALTTIQTTTDDHFLWIADHVRLQRFVTRYATITLAEHQQPAATISRSEPRAWPSLAPSRSGQSTLAGRANQEGMNDADVRSARPEQTQSEESKALGHELGAHTLSPSQPHPSWSESLARPQGLGWESYAPNHTYDEPYRDQYYSPLPHAGPANQAALPQDLYGTSGPWAPPSQYMTRTRTPPSYEPPPRDQEKEELKTMLAAMEAEKERAEADAQAAELEAKIRGEAEKALQAKLATSRR